MNERHELSGREYSRYQQGVIKRHYEHLDTKTVLALQEIATELYLTTSKPKADKLWERAAAHLAKTDVPKSKAAEVVQKRDIERLADLASKAKVPDRKKR